LENNESDEINGTIVHFKINNDFTVRKFFNVVNNQEKDIITVDSNIDSSRDSILISNRWYIDISNLCSEDDNKYFILVAVSNIDDEDMKSTTNKRKDRNETSTAIYRIELKKEEGNYIFDKDTKNTIIYRINKISGICKFIHKFKCEEVPSSEINKKKIILKRSIHKSKNKENDECFTLRRFIIFNFDGIHSFDSKDNFILFKKFDYPQCIERELKALDPSEISNCIDLLSSCIYDKYFLIENYKDNIQLLVGK
jgi:hypothetical protein